MMTAQLIVWTDSMAARETEKEFRFVLATKRERIYGAGTVRGTYNRVTMGAILAGLEKLEENALVYIYTDNRSVLTLAAHNLKQWEENGFMTTKNKPVANADLWKKISMKKRSFKLVGKPVNTLQREWLKEAVTE